MNRLSFDAGPNQGQMNYPPVSPSKSTLSRFPLSGKPTAERICVENVWRETQKRDGLHSRKGRPLSSVDVRSRQEERAPSIPLVDAGREKGGRYGLRQMWRRKIMENYQEFMITINNEAYSAIRSASNALSFKETGIRLHNGDWKVPVSISVYDTLTKKTYNGEISMSDVIIMLCRGMQS